jgi:Family of unknown function (DUF6069)
MTTIVHPTTASDQFPTTRYGLVRAASLAGFVAAGARYLDVPIAVDGQRIPLAGFAQLTIIGALIGAAIAAVVHRTAAHPRRTFLRLTIALAITSVIPDTLITATTGTKVVLAVTHVVAAAIIIACIGRRLAR